MTFSSIKPKIKNLGTHKTLAEIKRDGLRVAYNRADDSYWLIEGEFLRPVIKSPRECRSIMVDPKDLKYKIFMCGENREELRGSHALRYIEWGESRGFDKRPSCRGRKRWWDVGEQDPFDFIVLRFRDKRNWMPINQEPALFAGDIMFVGSWIARDAVDINNALINSTPLIIMSELLGRVNLGDGLLTTYGPEIINFLTIDSSVFSVTAKKSLLLAFELLKSRDVKSVFDEISQPDRRALDAIIFDALELTAGEREVVYSAVSDLVRRRLEKARSV